MADDEGSGGTWLLEPPAADEFSVVIRQGEDVEVPDDVRTAIEGLADALAAAGMSDEVSGFEMAGCVVRVCVMNTRLPFRSGTPGAAGAAGAAGSGAAGAAGAAGASKMGAPGLPGRPGT